MREFRRMEAEMREMFAPEEEEETPVAAPALPTVVVAPEVDEHAMQPVNSSSSASRGSPVMYGKQGEGETTLQWLTRNALGNPKISGKILEKGMQMLDQGTFGKLVSALTNMGGQQAQACEICRRTPRAAAGQWKPVTAPRVDPQHRMIHNKLCPFCGLAHQVPSARLLGPFGEGKPIATFAEKLDAEGKPVGAAKPSSPRCQASSCPTAPLALL